MSPASENVDDQPILIAELERYRSWLGLLARLQVEPRFRAKFDAFGHRPADLARSGAGLAQVPGRDRGRAGGLAATDPRPRPAS